MLIILLIKCNMISKCVIPTPSKLGLTIHMKYYHHKLIFVEAIKIIPGEIS